MWRVSRRSRRLLIPADKMCCEGQTAQKGASKERPPFRQRRSRKLSGSIPVKVYCSTSVKSSITARFVPTMGSIWLRR
ncbi:unnamed protein product [Gadus morhua 'NCC']